MHLNTLGLILTLICGLLLVPCASSAQQADKVWRIGLFHVASTTSLVLRPASRSPQGVGL